MTVQFPVITYIECSDEDYTALERMVRTIAKKNIGNEWTFVNHQPVLIKIGEVHIGKSLLKKEAIDGKTN